MKLNRLCLAGAAALALVACSGQSGTTLISGTVEDPDIQKVAVKMNSEVNPLDTTIAVVDGKFSIEVPTAPMQFGIISTDMQRLTFIPDGTSLKAVIADSSYIDSEASKSIHNDFIAYMNEYRAVDQRIRAHYDAINADASLSDDQKSDKFNTLYEQEQNGFIAYSKKAVENNPDNFIGLNALSNIYYELDLDELDGLIAGLSQEMKDHKFVKSVSESLEAKKATAEGQMFTDFEVQTVVGHDRSMKADPIYATAKLSDYVGKGKYVLVDFWSPWCGPCKREMPNIKAIYEKWHGDDFDVLSVAVWEREDVKVTMETADKLGVTWNQINNAKDIPTKLYGIDGIPHIILFGPDGTILKRGLHGAELAETVEKYMSEL